jgi:gluconolactonase
LLQKSIHEFTQQKAKPQCNVPSTVTLLAVVSAFVYNRAACTCCCVIHPECFCQEFLMPLKLCSALIVLFFVQVVQAQDLALNTVLIDGKDWELVSEGYKFTEGPAVNAQGEVFFTDIPESKIFKIGLDGKVTLFCENTEKTNGLMFGSDGKLYGCQSGTRKIVAYDAGAKAETVAEDIDSNDLVVAKDGGIYVTDPKHGQLWYISPKREKRLAAEGLKPNGVILWADQGTLVVTDAQDATLWTYRVEVDGGLTQKDRYYGPLRMVLGQTSTGSDGMTVDTMGRLYVATRAGLQMFDPIGRMGGVIHKPAADRPLSNVCFGGPKLDTLYVTAGDRVYKRATQATGVIYK